MKKLIQLKKNPILNTLSILVLGLFSILIIQGQSMNFSDENNPNVDRVPRDVMLYYALSPHVQHQPFVVTGTDGFDNFDMGNDFAEPYLSTSPNLPTSSFTAFNTNNGHWTVNGLDWTYVTPPAPNTAGDPWTAYDSLGNLYYITLNGSVSGTWVMKSTNNGQTWGTAVTGCTGNDRETMSCDQSGGPYKGYIYCGETSGGGASFYRSTDGGASFQSMFTFSPHNLPGFMTCSGPGPTGISGGAVYAVGSSGLYYAPTYTFWRSTDGGASFTLMSTQNNWVNTVGTQVGGRNSVNNMRLRPYPFVYADNSFGSFRGRFYVFYAANNPPGNGNKPDVYCRYSTDGGATFSNPTTVNDDANSTANNNFQEQAWVDKTTGKVYCQWMDTRNCPTSDSAEIYASYSTDGGVTFVTNQKISTAKMKIDCSTCPGGGSPRYQGDYTGLGSNATTSILAWTDYRNGGFLSMTAYFPDFALKINPTSNTVNNQNDSTFYRVVIPAIKLYTDKAKFTVTVTPTPSTGTITTNFLNRSTPALQDSLTSYPDSLRLRIKTSGGVTSGAYTITITGKGSNGTPVHARTVTLNVNPVGLISNQNQVPETYALLQNYPNPFNPSTNIRFDIPKSGFVKLSVYDITGKLVTTLVNSHYEAGKYSVSFNGENVSSGIYFYKIEAAGFTDIRKMILVK